MWVALSEPENPLDKGTLYVSEDKPIYDMISNVWSGTPIKDPFFIRMFSHISFDISPQEFTIYTPKDIKNISDTEYDRGFSDGSSYGYNDGYNDACYDSFYGVHI